MNNLFLLIKTISLAFDKHINAFTLSSINMLESLDVVYLTMFNFSTATLSSLTPTIVFMDSGAGPYGAGPSDAGSSGAGSSGAGSSNVDIKLHAGKQMKTHKPTLFNKKRKLVVSKSLTHIANDTGKTRHFTPAAQE